MIEAQASSLWPQVASTTPCVHPCPLYLVFSQSPLWIPWVPLSEAPSLLTPWNRPNSGAGGCFFLKPCGSVFFGIACTKIGMRWRLACPLLKDDTQIGEVFLLKNKKQTNLAFSHSFLASSSCPPPAHPPPSLVHSSSLALRCTLLQWYFLSSILAGYLS